MNKLNKILLALTIFATSVLSLQAEKVPSDTGGRMDIDAIKDRIKLVPIKDKSSKGINLGNAGWRKDKKDFYLTSHINFNEDVWQHIKIACIPKGNGQAKVMFLGAYNAIREKEKWFIYTNIKINGEEIIFNDKGWILQDRAAFITAKGPDGKDIKCVKGKCHAAGKYKVFLKKDTPIMIEFDVKYIK